jgi:hypothetical protein
MVGLWGRAGGGLHRVTPGTAGASSRVTCGERRTDKNCEAEGDGTPKHGKNYFKKLKTRHRRHIHMAAGLFFSFTRLFCFFFVTRGHPSTYIFILLAAPAKCGFPPLWPLWGSRRIKEPRGTQPGWGPGPVRGVPERSKNSTVAALTISADGSLSVHP